MRYHNSMKKSIFNILFTVVLAFFVTVAASKTACADDYHWVLDTGTGHIYNNNSSGKVGIGVTIPATKFHVKNGDLTVSRPAGDAKIYVGEDTSNAIVMQWVHNNDYASLQGIVSSGTADIVLQILAAILVLELPAL